VIVGLAASVSTGANASPRQARETFFDTFKSLCIDTGLDPRAVEQAVKNAGGTDHSPPGAMTDRPYRMGFKAWDLSVSGHRFLVTASFASPPNSNSMEGCRIRSLQNEDGSVPAIQIWLAVPPISKDTYPGETKQQRKTPMTHSRYQFQVSRGTHKPLNTDEEAMKASLAGQFWLAEIIQDGNSLDVDLQRDVPRGTPAN